MTSDTATFTPPIYRVFAEANAAQRWIINSPTSGKSIPEFWVETVTKLTSSKSFFGIIPTTLSSYDEKFFNEALEELENIERGEFLTYEEVFGEPQPGL